MPHQFPSIGKAEWLAVAEKSLRGKPLDSLDFTQANTVFTPFHHSEDRAEASLPLGRSRGWKIGVEIIAQDIATANTLALEALQGGAESLWFSFYRPKSAAQKEKLLEGIYTDIVDITIDEEETEGGRGSIVYDLNAAVKASIRNPTFHLYLNDHDFFGTLAYHRAVRLCWALAATELGIGTECQLVSFIRNATSEDKNSRLVSNTSTAMAAVCGGADTLYVPCHDSATSAFARRLARNVQHILHEESHLGRVADPAAGSYYLEALTDQIARQIWSDFQTLPR